MKVVEYISIIVALCASFIASANDSTSVDTSTYNMKVAAILPFFTNLVVDTIGPPPRREWRMREISMEHVNGLRWAALRLAQTGYNVELNLFDEVPDTLDNRLWEFDDINGMDVVFGPLQQSVLSKSMGQVERSGAEHILLTKVNPHLLNYGAHIRSIIPAKIHYTDLIINKLLTEHVNDNVIFVIAGGSDLPIEQHFLDLYPIEPLPYDSLLVDTIRFDTVLGSRNSIGTLADKIQFYERNVVVSLASKRSRSMLSSLQSVVQKNDSTEIYVYAGSDVKDLGFIDLPFLTRTRTTIPVSGEVDWSDSTTVEAVKIFRDLYDTDPTDYAIRAHDALLDAFARKLDAMPLDSAILAEDSLASWDLSSLPAPIATRFEWSQTQEDGGWVNSTWELSTFHNGQWCTTDIVPGLMPFIEPQLDEEGFYIRED